MEMKTKRRQANGWIIPEEWDVKPLGDIGTWRGGMTPSMRNPAFWDAGEFPWVSSGDVKTSRLSDTNQHVTSYAVRCGAAVVVPTDSIVIVTRSGILRKYLPVALISRAMAINQDIKVLIPAKTVNNDYLLHALTGFGDLILSRCLKAGTTVESVEFPWLKAFHIPLPPLTEQRVIAEALSDMDELLIRLDRLITKKRDIKQATMQLLLTGKTRLPGFSGNWEVKRLREMVSTPITDGPHLTPKFTAQGIPFLSVNNLVNNRIDLSSLRFISLADHLEFSKKCKPKKNDILFGKAASVGMVGIIETDIELNIWSPLALIRVKETISAKFTYYALQANHIHCQIKLLTNSSSQGNIGMGDINLLSIPLPSHDEQSAIATVLSDIDDELSALEARRDKTRALKQGMMQELLTGKIRLI